VHAGHRRNLLPNCPDRCSFCTSIQSPLRTISADLSGQIPANVLRPSHSAQKKIAATCRQATGNTESASM
jgi:hypothetical protein